jgi:hypothetical protein
MTEAREPSVGAIVRAMFGTATVVFLVTGVATGWEPRLLGAGAAFGTIWWLWDLFMDHVARPFGDWLTHGLMEGAVGTSRTYDLPTLEDTIRLLESHLAHDASRQVHLNAAIRLEEIYRTVRHDPARAREVILRMRERYPDAPELSRYDGDGTLHV